jgi:Tfp pilus assembly protein PilX
MSSAHKTPSLRPRQHGIVLFFALIALVALSLAAVALIRTVDTSTIIAGNLSFKQAATSSGDNGIENAITWLMGIAAASSAINVVNNPELPFNQDSLTSGYYSNFDPNLDLLADSTWESSKSALAGADPDPVTGNTTRYIIQRMCRTANTAIQTADCLFSGARLDNNGQHVKLPQEVCQGDGCPAAGQTPMVRITTRTVGPKNTVSYVQALVY